MWRNAIFVVTAVGVISGASLAAAPSVSLMGFELQKPLGLMECYDLGGKRPCVTYEGASDLVQGVREALLYYDEATAPSFVKWVLSML